MTTNAQTKAQWFEDAGFGLFVHWNLASLADADSYITTYPIDTSNANDVPEQYLRPEDYQRLAKQFDPDAYNPDEWLAAARRAGMEYAVLTTKHHLGFCLWPSEYGEFSVKQYLDGRDLVQEFIEACRRQGLKVGLYYSLPDWSHPDFFRRDKGKFDHIHEEEGVPEDIAPQYGAGHDSGHQIDHISSQEGPKLEDLEELRLFERYYKFVKGQVRELITWYGELDLLWFDSPLWRETVDWRLGDIYNMVRSEQSQILVNGRGGYSQFADYWDTENTIPEIPEKKWGENSQQWAPETDHWFYQSDKEYRDMEWTLDRLATTVGLGGNLLLNVGPKPNGEFPAQAYERLSALEEWMKQNKPSIKGVDPGPWPPKSSMPITRDDGVWYVHVLADATEPIKVTGVPEPTAIHHLRTGQSVDYTFKDKTLTFDLISDQQSTGDEVVAVSWPRAHQHRL